MILESAAIKTDNFDNDKKCFQVSKILEKKKKYTIIKATVACGIR